MQFLTLHLAASHKLAFFRGRKLHGRVIKLPHSHGGSIVRVTDAPTKADEKRTAQRRDLLMDFEEDEEMDDEDQCLEETVAEELATFDEITVWDHDRTPVAAEDTYVMAVEEWIGLAQAVRKPDTTGSAMLTCLDSFYFEPGIKFEEAIIDRYSVISMSTAFAEACIHLNTDKCFLLAHTTSNVCIQSYSLALALVPFTLPQSPRISSQALRLVLRSTTLIQV